jgi:hypothetical protein
MMTEKIAIKAMRGEAAGVEAKKRLQAIGGRGTGQA